VIAQSIRDLIPREKAIAMRADYAADELSVDEICQKHKVSSGTLYYLVDGGPPSGDLHLPPLPRRSAGVARAALAPGAKRAALVKRMWRTAELQVRDIEQRLKHAMPEPLERERDARVLAVLAKTLRELSALDASQQDNQTIAPEDDDPIPRDIDEFRRELARRIHALVESRTGGRIPGEPGSGME
jgi:AcrR family transcriptional regulator